MQAFNQMEERLRSERPALPEGDALMAMAVLEAKDIIKNLKPEADYARKVLDNQALTPITAAVKAMVRKVRFISSRFGSPKEILLTPSTVGSCSSE